MKKRLLVGLIIILVVVAAIIGVLYYRQTPIAIPVAEKPQENILIGFSMGTLQEERWQRDKEEFLKRADELGVVVDLQDSNNNTEKQISQIKGMIMEGVDVLVIAPYDADSLAEVIGEAHQAGIKVLSYDRLIRNTAPDLYLSFDNEKVGEYQADYVLKALADKLSTGEKLKIAYVGGAPTDNNALLLKTGSFKLLQPKIDSGEIEIVFEEFTADWSPDKAYENLKKYLAENKDGVDGVVAANDGTAFGAITALSEYGFSGQVPVSGQDAELSALRRIVAGTQTVTVYKPISKLAGAAVELAIRMAKDQKINTTGVVNNGQADVPAVLLESVPVTKDNIDDTIIKDGYYPREDVYKK
jgi:D-xylose transport system substrate-binding protein